MQLARRRLRVARYSIGATAVAAFAAFGLVVRDAHPATHSAPVSAAAAGASTTLSPSAQDSTGLISPAPLTVAPTIQSAGS